MRALTVEAAAVADRNIESNCRFEEAALANDDNNSTADEVSHSKSSRKRPSQTRGGGQGMQELRPGEDSSARTSPS